MIIAEIAQAHDGSLGILHSYIDALADTGVDAVKFQTHIADAESSIHEPFRVKFSYEDETRFDYWRRMEFTLDQWKEIKQHCEDRNLEFISSPFSNAAIDLLEAIEIKRYKVGSGEINNHLLLKKIALTGKPVILSSGLSNIQELDRAVNFFKEQGTDVSVLQCVSAYPSQPEEWGLNMINEFKQRYRIKTGYSDHSGDIYACLAAASLGAEIFEFHIVFHKAMFGPDTKASIIIDDVKKLVKGIKQIQSALHNPSKKEHSDNILSLKNVFEKSLAVNRPLSAGTVITFEHLEAKKPKGQGIDTAAYQAIIGKKLIKDKQRWDFLRNEDLQ